ncbi:MAG: nicotinate-nucleotide adenylyltransferase [Thermodesulfobacteriota bacterium]
MLSQTGVVHGRFQLFHLDHLKYVLAAKARCRHLVVAITNPDPTLTKFDPADPHRSSTQDNPLTFYERYVMLRDTLLDQGLEFREFSLVPLPINFPELYRYYVPLDATFYLTIYDEWGERKLQLFESLNLNVEILWRKPGSEKGLTASAIRGLMGLGQPWEHLVPEAVARLVREMDLLQRLKIMEA